MSGPLVLERCWQHAGREAVCRCLGCGRSFCRECVSEHEGRLLCAACLAAAAGSARAAATPGRRWLAPLAAMLGLMLSWLFFYGAGVTVMELASRFEEQVHER